VKKTGLFLTICACLLVNLLFSQAPDPVILVRGNVFDRGDSLANPAAIVLNQRTMTGQNTPPGMNFSISGIKSDTFLITAGGYEVRRICFRDSVLRDVYTVHIGLKVKTTTLAPVAIYPVKDLEAIQKERAAIAKEQTREAIGFTGAVSSPITFLWEHYSREGRSREAVAILENEDNKRDILKELFRTYARAGVIVMEEDEYDSFINYLNIPEEFLRNASDYDLAVWIRQRYLVYRSAQEIHNRNQR
jgi:hypothetical protein